MQLEKIKPSLQRDVIHSFWTMLGECESLAHSTNDATLKTQVEGWIRQWNTMTDDNKVARWIAK